MLTTAQIEHILDNFNQTFENFEIINIEEKKGWSSRYLYLIVEHNSQFVLKGKSKDQLSGFMADIEISNFLKEKGFSVRESILTKTGEVHQVVDDIYWELKSYVTGSVEEFVNYTDQTVTSLAKLNAIYITSSLNSPVLSSLKLDTVSFPNHEEIVTKINTATDTLNRVIGNESKEATDWFRFAGEELKTIFTKNTDKSIIHNDLNSKNILLDLNTMSVTSFIDWDHGCISTPLKDMLEPVNMFYDFVPEKYDSLKQIYLTEFSKYYKTNLTQTELDFIQVYFYALSKWKYITFFANLIKDLGDSTGELEIFQNQIKSQLAKLKDLGKKCKVF